MATPDLLQEIENFLARADVGLSETAFGKQSVNDGKFIPNLRNGRRVWPETEEKVRVFMRDFSSHDRGEPGDHNATPENHIAPLTDKVA